MSEDQPDVQSIDPSSTPAGNPAGLKVRDLAKSYGEVKALAGISFDVAPGEVFGLLGHNGAGKTTTIRILTGRTPPTAGTAQVGGFDIVKQREEARALLNLVFEDQNLYERLSGYDNLKLFADLYDAPKGRTEEVLKRVGIADAADRKVKTYSTGMKQRLLLGRGLINDPAVLFLDEPTRGLDPVSARNLRGIVRELSDSGTTVFLTTHDMVEADELCDRVGFISEGKLIALDTPRELKLLLGERRTRSVEVLLADRSIHQLQLENPQDVAQLSEWLQGSMVLTIHSNEPTLADVFVDLAGRSLTDAEEVPS